MERSRGEGKKKGWEEIDSRSEKGRNEKRKGGKMHERYG